MMVMNPDILRRIDDLQARYIDALDRRDMAAWLSVFSESGSSYICRTAESEDANLPISLVMDDCHERLQDRVKFVNEVWAGTYQDYRTRHVVQRISCNAEKLNAGSPELVSVRSNFIVTYTSKDQGRSEIFSSGVYIDKICLSETGESFYSKKVVLDVPMLPHYMVYPI